MPLPHDCGSIAVRLTGDITIRVVGTMADMRETFKVALQEHVPWMITGDGGFTVAINANHVIYLEEHGEDA